MNVMQSTREKKSHSVGFLGTTKTLQLYRDVTEWRFNAHKQSLMSTVTSEQRAL